MADPALPDASKELVLAAIKGESAVADALTGRSSSNRGETDPPEVAGLREIYLRSIRSGDSVAWDRTRPSIWSPEQGSL